MAKKRIGIVWVFVIIAILAAGSYGIYWYLTQTAEGKEMFDFIFYDKEGNPIIKGLSIVGGTEGVYSMETRITVTNTGDLTTTYNIDTVTSTPNLWSDGFTNNCDTTIKKDGVYQTCKPAQSRTLSSGQSATWTSALVKTEPYESDTSTTFTIYIDGTYTYAGETKTMTKSASANVLIEPDPSAEFEIDIIIS